MNQKINEMLINLDDVSDDEHYKISKKNLSPELEASIRISGMVEKPVLIKTADKYLPLTCHNRILLLKKIGVESVFAGVIDKPDYNLFLNNAAVKIFRGEIGPVSRLKILHIISDEFSVSADELADIAKKILKIPADIYTRPDIIKSIDKFPVVIKDYIDTKDNSFKIIKDLSALDNRVIHEITRWIEKVQIRGNIFKMLIDFLFDITRRDGKLDPVDEAFLDSIDDKKLYDYIFNIRYPEYSLKKVKAEFIVNSLSRKGVSVDFPEYFERDEITLKFMISKKEKVDLVTKRINELDYKKINELLSLL